MSGLDLSVLNNSSEKERHDSGCSDQLCVVEGVPKDSDLVVKHSMSIAERPEERSALDSSDLIASSTEDELNASLQERGEGDDESLREGAHEMVGDGYSSGA